MTRQGRPSLPSEVADAVHPDRRDTPRYPSDPVIEANAMVLEVRDMCTDIADAWFRYAERCTEISERLDAGEPIGDHIEEIATIFGRAQVLRRLGSKP